LREVPREPELCREFVAALGREIVQQHHILLNGCQGSVDKEVAIAAKAWLDSNGGNSDASIISYRLRSYQQVHEIGRVRLSSLPDWLMNHAELRVPEQIELADATIFIAGRRYPPGQKLGFLRKKANLGDSSLRWRGWDDL
jgi:hypothetical protein